MKFSATTMAAPLALELGTPAASQVQSAIHDILVRHGLAAGDDAVMAEYVTVMMANHKGPEAVASELGELVGGVFDPAITEQIWSAATSVLQPPKPQPPKPQPPKPQPPPRRQRSASPPLPRREARHAEDSQQSRDKRDRQDRWESSGTRNDDNSRDRGQKESRGRGRRGGMASDTPQLSIFGRAGVPDPHAPPFEPRTVPEPAQAPEPAEGTASSLKERLGPGAEAPPRDIALFPTAPTNSALCHYSTHCTNPMCPFSHPSPANAGRGGDEMALVLREEPCEKGSDCTDRDCVMSHVSPAVTFVKKRGVAPPPAIGGVPCRFQASCLNPTCPYVHTDPFGRVVPPPASQTTTMCRFGSDCKRPDCRFAHPRTIGIPCRYGAGCTRPDCMYSHERQRPVAADRLAPFSVDDGECELILPGGTPTVH